MDGGKKVILSIRGNQVNPDGEDNRIELITEGRLYKKATHTTLNMRRAQSQAWRGPRPLLWWKTGESPWSVQGPTNPDLF